MGLVVTAAEEKLARTVRTAKEAQARSMGEILRWITSHGDILRKLARVPLGDAYGDDRGVV
jgi:hypothetical protein